MWWVRWTNLVCGVLLGVGALGFFILGPYDLPEFSRQVGDTWLDQFWHWVSQSWVGFVWALLSALCFANTRWANNTDRLNLRALANLAAVLFLGLLLVRGSADPAEPLVLVFLALGPLVALAGAWRQSQVQPR